MHWQPITLSKFRCYRSQAVPASDSTSEADEIHVPCLQYGFNAKTLFMIAMRTLLLCIAVSLTCPPLFAKGGPMHSEDRYNPQHIDSLPAEIHDAFVGKCHEPRALHDFAVFKDGTSKIILHYEYLLCGQSHSYCTATSCLHQVYMRSANGRYRLLRSFYVAQPEYERC